MSDVSHRYAAIATDFTSRVENVPPAGWSASTPCTEWTVRDLVAHVITVHGRMMARLDGTDPDAVGAEPDQDLVGLWRVRTGTVQDALLDQNRASTVVHGIMGDRPFEELVSGLLCADTLVHTWDLARATGQDERLDPGAVAKSMEFLSGIDSGLRRPGGFAERIESAPDADEQTRFLNFCGRAV